MNVFSSHDIAMIVMNSHKIQLFNTLFLFLFLLSFGLE